MGKKPAEICLYIFSPCWILVLFLSQYSKFLSCLEAKLNHPEEWNKTALFCKCSAYKPLFLQQIILSTSSHKFYIKEEKNSKIQWNFFGIAVMGVPRQILFGLFKEMRRILKGITQELFNILFKNLLINTFFLSQ